MKAWIKHIAVWATVVASSVSATARLQEIKIDQAVNSPTLTVRFTKMAAALVELRVNGRSASTRTISGSALSGETNFTIDESLLNDGDNQIEIVIFDKAGKMVGTQKSVLKATKVQDSPVAIEGMRSGETVQGLIEIKLGVNRDFREMYVSFFVDDQWKALKNYPPYSFVWDTSRYPNGWHEVEAWVVDESNTTYKTRKVRVFVNNPGGRTERVQPTTPKATVKPAVKPAVKPTVKPTVKATAAKPAVAAKLSPVVATTAVAKPSGLKGAKMEHGIPTDQKAMMPTGKRVVAKAPVAPTTTTKPVATKPAVKTVAPKPTTKPALPAVKPTAKAPKADVKAMPKVATLSVGKGTRLPNIGTYTVLLSGKIVKFDVQPKVVDGVPLTPFRHLFEQAGGKVKWEHLNKIVSAQGLGREIRITIGMDRAMVDKKWVNMELAAYIEGSRTIVPLSFIKDSLDVKIDYDPETKRVLITEAK